MHLASDHEKSSRRPKRPRGAQRDSSIEVPRILIVEDALFVAWDLESKLVALGFDVCGIAAQGEEAVRLASTLNPNLLLMDINLGQGIDGIEAARRISEFADVAVVFVTAYSDRVTKERIDAAFPGAPVVHKPATQEHLRAAIVAAGTAPRG